jgi:hypothetical protein
MYPAQKYCSKKTNPAQKSSVQLRRTAVRQPALPKKINQTNNSCKTLGVKSCFLLRWTAVVACIGVIGEPSAKLDENSMK